MLADQVEAEEKFLKQTTAPNIKLKHRERNKFLYSTNRLRRQIKAARQPKSMVNKSVDELLHIMQTTALTIVRLRLELLDGNLEENKVGVVLDNETIQIEIWFLSN